MNEGIELYSNVMFGGSGGYMKEGLKDIQDWHFVGSGPTGSVRSCEVI